MQKIYRKIATAVVAVMVILHQFHLMAQSPDATGTVNYSQSSGITVKPGAFGLNLFQGFNPAYAGVPGNAAYKEGMAFMKPGIVRYHSSEMLGQSTNQNGWLLSNYQWDAAKINNAMTSAHPWNPLVIMNIPGWPSIWSDSTGKLLPAHYSDFAEWCADLVRIINIDQKRAVKYWEVPNEKDDLYGSNGEELGRLYNIAAIAMKQVDPTIKVGGPAFARPDLIDRVDAFFSIAHPNLDFVTYHSYANGSPNSPLKDVWDRAEINGKITSGIRAEFEKFSSKTIEYFHDEYNISWAPPDPHQNNYVSMIFDAILTLTAVKDGATGTMAWNEADGWYGKMGGNFDLRPAAYMFNNFNTNLIGSSVNTTTSSNASSLFVFASSNGSLRHLVVVNRSAMDQRYKFSFSGLPSAVNGSTLFTNKQNTEAGGTVTSDVSYAQLTSPGGAFFPKNTVSLLTIDLNNLRSTGDLTAPSAPTSLRSTNSDYSLTLQWNASTDNVGVTGYDIYVNGALNGSSTTTSYLVNWLDPSTSYSFYVKAKDATGNESAPSATYTASTTAYSARPVASVFSPTSWSNNFSGNVINDAGQTTTHAGSAALRQNEELRMILTNTPQYDAVYVATFANTIDLTGNSEFKVDARSNQSFALRVKLFDDQGNSIDAWQNGMYFAGDNTMRTYTINFANNGFGSVNPAKVKGLVFMYPDGGTVNATVFFDNLRLGVSSGDTQAPTAPTNLTSPSKTTSSVNLSWTASTDNVGVAGYDVFNGTTKVNTSAITTTSYNVTGLSANTAYTFTVKALDAAGNISAASNALTVTTASNLRDPENPSNTTSGLEYKYYQGTWTVLPDFNTLTPVKTGNVANFDLSVKSRSDQFGLSFTGFVNVPTDGTYTFYTTSDDGSKLFIGSTEVVNNDGLHGAQERSGSIGLKAGKHAIRVVYFDNTGGELLTVSYQGPGISKQAIPFSVLFRTSVAFSGYYKIVAKHSGKVLDVAGRSTSDGALVNQYSYNGGDNQKWTLVDMGSGYYKIVGKQSNKVLDVPYSSTVNGAHIQIWEDNGTDAQRWRVEPVSGGYFKIIAKVSGKALDVQGKSTANGAKVQQYTYNGTDNQLWQIVSVPAAGMRLSSDRDDDLEISSEEAVDVYPNPALTDVTVSFYLKEKRKVHVKLYDQTSKVRLTKDHEGEAGINTIVIPVSQFSNGIYFIAVDSGYKTVTKKILVNK